MKIAKSGHIYEISKSIFVDGNLFTDNQFHFEPKNVLCHFATLKWYNEERDKLTIK